LAGTKNILENMANNNFQKKFKGKTVLITGANGFIGSHLAQALINYDCRIYALFYGAESKVINNRKIQWLKGDVRDQAAMKKLINRIKPNFVFHLAAVVDSSRDLRLIKEMVETNLLGTLNLLLSLENVKFQKMVFLGSCEEYGLGIAPFKESQPTMAVSPYGFSKIAASGLCSISSRILDYPIIVLRPTVVYGPGQEGKMFLPSLLWVLLDNSLFEMSKGGQKRDFIYIKDLIDAILISGVSNIKGEIINIGSGKAYSLKKVALLAKKLSGSKSQISFALPYRQDEIMNYSCDISKAKKLLKWKPQYSLEDGLRETIESFQDK
jgi:nucleoside-diphosphate-sugar epimerase